MDLSSGEWRSLVCATLASTLLLGACAHRETIPQVSIAPNKSGIAIAKIEQRNARNLMVDTLPPDIPAGVSVRLARRERLHNLEPRYFVKAAGELQVVNNEHPQRYGTTKNVQERRRLLREGATAEAQNHLFQSQLKEVPWTNAGRCFHAKLRKRVFPWGEAMLFLTSYVQGITGGPVNNDMLVLVVQGFTTDGRFTVNGRFEIHHPKLPDSLWDKREAGKAIFDLDHDNRAAERWLDKQPDASFNPTLQAYEEFLKSVQIY